MLKMYVIGTEIVITPYAINEVIRFFARGMDVDRYYHVHQDCDFFKSAKGLEFLKTIHRNSNIVWFVKPRSKDLNIKARVIHDMITHTILPCDKHRDLMSCIDLYVMEKLYSGKKFDLGCLILGHMLEIDRTSNKNLAYDTLIQKIVERAGIQLP